MHLGRFAMASCIQRMLLFFLSAFFVGKTNCASKDPTTYWRKLKQRLKEEGNETVTNCHQLKLLAADGKMRMTDAADTQQLLRIIHTNSSA